MADRWTAAQVEEALARLPGWVHGDNTLERAFTFADHVAAMGFVVRVAMVAEVMNHHPDLRIVYNRVELKLSSHDAGGVTERDAELARKVSALVEPRTG
ncbi:MAG: 4a-hydroxytetrahydrobiopterin dehydratase [Dehalococcoidia bacterium]|nr:4a-hydroxytetrahydrobiopterin dehydratase [Dehalococcoidia bacterium]